MTQIIDLSYPYGDDLPPMSGHPVMEYRLINSHEEHHRTNAVMSFSIHMGTHLDPPYHFFEDGATIDQIPIERFYLPGYLFDLRGEVSPYTAVRLEQLEERYRRQPASLKNTFVAINTGWAERAYRTEEYYKRAPWLDVPVAEWLVDQGVSIVGLDTPPDKLTPDPNTGRLEPGDSPIHKTLLGNGVLIAENVANMEQLGAGPFHVAAFPLNIYRGCGGPSRIVALLD